jgi:hypothetical protein
MMDDGNTRALTAMRKSSIAVLLSRLLLEIKPSARTSKGFDESCVIAAAVQKNDVENSPLRRSSRICEQEGKYTEAIRHLEQALERHPH